MLKEGKKVKRVLRKHLKIKNIWEITGRSHDSTQPFSIIYAGNTVNEKYFARIIFGEHYRAKHVGDLWFWQFFDMICQQKKLAFVIVEMNHNKARRLFPGHSFFIPNWLNGTVDLENGFTCCLNRNRTIKYNMRKILQCGFTYEICNSETNLGLFYEKMYLPFISIRHDELACIRTYGDMKTELNTGDILFIKMGEKVVAGVMISYRKEIPELKWLGVLDGNLEYMKNGIVSGLFYYGMKYLREKGHREVLLGYSRPFFSDGALKYKRINWDMKICDHDAMGVWFKPIILNNGSRQFLLNTPFNAILGKEKKGIIFAEYEQLKSSCFLEKLKKQYLFDGISGLEVFLFGMNGDQNVNNLFSYKPLNGIEIKNAERLFHEKES